MTNSEFDIKEDSFYSEETYSKGLSREDTLERQIRIITYFYSRGLWDEFEHSLKALIPLLPKVVREQFTPLPHDKTKVEEYWSNINNSCFAHTKFNKNNLNKSRKKWHFSF